MIRTRYAVFCRHHSSLTNCAQITEYRFIKVTYESVVDWHVKTDYLRCNPQFHGHPRYDFIIADIPSRGRIFARLVCVFVCHVNECDYHFALVQALDKNTRTSTKSADKDLSIFRQRIRPRNRCKVIPLTCIIRGAVLAEDIKHKDDYFVIDTVDEDMFLRVKKMYYEI